LSAWADKEKGKLMKDRLTVLFPIDALTVGGAEQQLLELVRLLDKTRFEPIVLSMVSGGPLEHEFRTVPGVELLSLNRKGKHDFFCLFNIIRIIRSRRVDIVQPYLTPANLFGLLAAMICRTPVKIMTRRPGIPPKGAPLGSRLYYKAEAFLARFVDWVIPNSQAGKEYMLSQGVRQERIKVIPNGINLTRLTNGVLTTQEARLRLGLAADSKVLGTVARLAPVKAHSVLFQAATRVIKVIPDTKFILVGDGPLRQPLEELAQELGLSSIVVFYGEQRDVGVYLSAIDVAVLPSQEEGCSNFLLEAMAMAKPAVATDIIGNRDVVCNGETGLLVPFGNAEAVADAILSLILDPEATRAMGQRAREDIVTRFSLGKMAHEYECLYEETLRQKARRKIGVERS
jgi:glycosyltransferase involved in cell wall biosynthesis